MPKPFVALKTSLSAPGITFNAAPTVSPTTAVTPSVTVLNTLPTFVPIFTAALTK